MMSKSTNSTTAVTSHASHLKPTLWASLFALALCVIISGVTSILAVRILGIVAAFLVACVALYLAVQIDKRFRANNTDESSR